MDKKYHVTFAPEAFRDFEGTQEELDEFVKAITEMVESGEFLADGRFIPISDLPEDLYDEIMAPRKSTRLQ